MKGKHRIRLPRLILVLLPVGAAYGPSRNPKLIRRESKRHAKSWQREKEEKEGRETL